MNKVLCCFSYVYFICVYQQHDRSLPTTQSVLTNNTIGANQRHHCKSKPFYRHYINFLTEVVDNSLKKLPIGQTKRQYGRGTKKGQKNKYYCHHHYNPCSRLEDKCYKEFIVHPLKPNS